MSKLYSPTPIYLVTWDEVHQGNTTSTSEHWSGPSFGYLVLTSPTSILVGVLSAKVAFGSNLIVSYPTYCCDEELVLYGRRPRAVEPETYLYLPILEGVVVVITVLVA